MFSISDLAKEFGVSPRTLRHYEKKGLLFPSRDARDQRVYSRQDRRRLILALRGASIGFTLAVIATFLNNVFKPPDGDLTVAVDKLDEVIEVLTKKQADTETTLNYLKSMRPKLVAHMERRRRAGQDVDV